MHVPFLAISKDCLKENNMHEEDGDRYGEKQIVLQAISFR